MELLKEAAASASYGVDLILAPDISDS